MRPGFSGGTFKLIFALAIVIRRARCLPDMADQKNEGCAAIAPRAAWNFDRGAPGLAIASSISGGHPLLVKL